MPTVYETIGAGDVLDEAHKASIPQGDVADACLLATSLLRQFGEMLKGTAYEATFTGNNTGMFSEHGASLKVTKVAVGPIREIVIAVRRNGWLEWKESRAQAFSQLNADLVWSHYRRSWMGPRVTQSSVPLRLWHLDGAPFVRISPLEALMEFLLRTLP